MANIVDDKLIIEDRIVDTVCNDLSKKILEKYMAPGEKTPEDVFMRVAMVCSIPNVVDGMLENDYFFYKDMREAFEPYQDLYDRVIKRRKIKVISSHRVELPTIEEIKEAWKRETEKYYKEMCELNLMPASPTLMNSGNFGMLSSCFFLRIEDSMDGIFDAVKRVGVIAKAGGGVGLDFSLLRPEGAKIKGTGGTSSGPISFMEVFNATGETVKQGGRRKGALLASLRIDHPDIVKFIKCKNEEGKLNNFNISVLVTDRFMEQLEKDRNKSKGMNDHVWVCKFKGADYKINAKTDQAEMSVYSNAPPMAIVDPPYYTVPQIWNLLCKQAHMNGEPGAVYHNHVNKKDIFHGKYGELGQNPCSELHLLNYESCNLAAINLTKCIKDTSVGNIVDYEKLERLVKLGIRFLDNVVDLNKYPLPEIEEVTLKTRKIGLGVLGFHDMLLCLGIPYGGERCMNLINDLWGRIEEIAQEKSEELAQTRGTFPGYEDLDKEHIAIKYKRRNAGLLTCQPTGTVAMICNQVSSGIEPNFQWSYKRKDSYGEHEIKHWILDEYKELPGFAKTALEILPEDHVKVQAQIQQYIDSGISKTVNLPNTATKEDVNKVFKLAYELACKSITIYRTGSRKEEVLVKETKLNQNLPLEPQVKQPNLVKSEDWNGNDRRQGNIRKRPRVLLGATIKINTPSGPAYITLNEDAEGLRECLVSASKAGSEVAVHTAVEGRLISNSLQYRVPIESIIQHLKNQKSSPIWESGETVKSLPDAIAKAIELYRKNYEGFSEYLPDDVIEATKEEKTIDEPSGELCPECGENLYMEGGCDVCRSCGHSTCG